MHVLDQEAEGLANRLRSLTLEERRRVLAKSCLLACETIFALEPAVLDLLNSISVENAISQNQIVWATSLAHAADEEYITLRERGASEAEWLNSFAKARLLTAIAGGFSGNLWTDTADAIYELCKTRDDPSSIINLVESEIGNA
ncbi:MAG TPA: hypothetical protein VGV87_22810 [Blastocatellia bacterium]|jgi:hypothetical protein|nr:hypothetical protein [Blastocatellia bacterium]